MQPAIILKYYSEWLWFQVDAVLNTVNTGDAHVVQSFNLKKQNDHCFTLE